MKFKITVFKKPILIDIKFWCAIHEEDIQKDLVNHGEYLAYIGTLKAHKKYEVGFAEQEVKECFARIYVYLKEQGRKYTEKQLESKVIISKEYTAIKNKYLIDLKELNLLESLYDAIKDKKEMLVQVSSNMKLDKRLAINWEKRLSAMEQQLQKYLEVTE